MFKVNDCVRVVQSTNTVLAQHTAYVGRTGLVLAVDHPSCGIAGGLTVVLNPMHNSFGEKEHRKLAFLNESEVEPA